MARRDARVAPICVEIRQLDVKRDSGGGCFVLVGLRFPGVGAPDAAGEIFTPRHVGYMTGTPPWGGSRFWIWGVTSKLVRDLSVRQAGTSRELTLYDTPSFPCCRFFVAEIERANGWLDASGAKGERVETVGFPGSDSTGPSTLRTEQVPEQGSA